MACTLSDDCVAFLASEGAARLLTGGVIMGVPKMEGLFQHVPFTVLPSRVRPRRRVRVCMRAHVMCVGVWVGWWLEGLHRQPIAHTWHTCAPAVSAGGI